jgi:hypothetical protein
MNRDFAKGRRDRQERQGRRRKDQCDRARTIDWVALAPPLALVLGVLGVLGG